MDIVVISIGTLSKNPLWGEKVPVRTSHATTTLLRQDKEIVLVDPSLPPPLLQARLFERTGLQPSAITQVFLTNWRPVHRRALTLFEGARWLMNSLELESAQQVLTDAAARFDRQQGSEDPESGNSSELMKSEAALLKRVEPAPEELMENVDLFPLPGYTPGQAGLLVSTATMSTIIAGDAVATAEHFSAGQVFPDCWDINQAKESLMEMYEIADLIIPGHDNIFLVPRGRDVSRVI